MDSIAQVSPEEGFAPPISEDTRVVDLCPARSSQSDGRVQSGATSISERMVALLRADTVPWVLTIKEFCTFTGWSERRVWKLAERRGFPLRLLRNEGGGQNLATVLVWEFIEWLSRQPVSTKRGRGRPCREKERPKEIDALANALRVEREVRNAGIGGRNIA